MKEGTKTKILVVFIILCWMGILFVFLNSRNLDCDKCTIEFRTNKDTLYIEKISDLKQKFDEGICVLKYDKIMGVVKNYDLFEN